MEPLYTSSTELKYLMLYTSGCFGVDNPEFVSDSLLEDLCSFKPSIEATKNSNLDLMHVHIDRNELKDLGGSPGHTTNGLMLRATDDSKITCRGTSQYANIFIGPGNTKIAGAYAGRNSSILFQGPTSMIYLGVDALAEDNSLIDFGPIRNDSNIPMLSSFDLSSDGSNHTMVELHSTRASLVANRNSVINIQDLGYYEYFWTNSPHSTGVNATDYDYQLDEDVANCVSGGFMQLYPNAQGQGIFPTLPSSGSILRYRFREDTASIPTNYYYMAALAAANKTTGGMSVRAVGDSLVNVKNVHFPCGWGNTSSFAYDYNGGGPLPIAECSRIHIWNIADTSKLKASYTTVSGLHPYDSGYYGPSGTWGAVSASPSSTPDTSALSILDYYGENNQHILGKSSHENFGPFRLFFSVDPAARFLESSGTGLSGLVYQLFSQGYSWSGPAIPVERAGFPHPSSTYRSLLFTSASDPALPPDLVLASGFYYPSSMLSNPNTILASLDESAANTFANAKHNSVGKSGLAKVVEIFFPTNLFGGDSDSESTYGDGLLSVNNFDLSKDN
jgi:hypothetical protein